MTSVERVSSEAIRAAGLDALRRALGPAGMVRFLQQFETGRGDYSQERHAWLDEVSVMDLAGALEARRAKP